MTSHSPERREPNDLPAGTVINGKFRIVSLLASGGMGRIYRAEQAPLGRVVAIKVLRTPHNVSPKTAGDFRKRFFREASILAKLQHVNVVTLFDYGRIEGEADERYFMAMEYLAGETLGDRLKASHIVQVPDALRILRQMARGLREAHRLGAVHRDLKPSNIMLVPEEDGGEVVKILDFGIGKLIENDDADQEITQEGAFLGSPRYIAPEMVNERRVDARTDVYSLGVIAYECLSGRVPLQGETNLETILAHCNRPVPPIAERSPGVVVPEVVEAFVRRCLEKEPSKRPQSMEDVLRGISECEHVLYGVTSLGALSSRDGGPTPVMPHRISSRVHLVSTVPPPSMGTQSPLTVSGGLPPRGGTSRAGVAAAIATVVALVLGLAVVLALRVSTRGPGVAAASGGPAATATAGPAVTAPPLAAPSSELAASPATSAEAPPGASSMAPSAVATASTAAPSASAASTQSPPPHPTRWAPPRATAAPTQSPQPDLDIKLHR